LIGKSRDWRNCNSKESIYCSKSSQN